MSAPTVTTTIVDPTPKTNQKLANPTVPTSVNDALKAVGHKPVVSASASGVAPAAAASVSAAAPAQKKADSFEGMTKEVLAVLARLNCPHDPKKSNFDRAHAQKAVVAKWQSDGDSAKGRPCPNTCPITMTWTPPNNNMITLKNGEKRFLSQHPLGRCRVLRWNAFGQRHGMEECYDANGALYYSVEWKNGCRVGVEMFYDPANGRVKRLVPWTVRVCSVKQVAEDGTKKTVKVRRSFVDGVETRIEGNICRTISWKRGVRDGEEKTMHTSSQTTLSVRMWINGKTDGQVVQRYRNGKIAYKGSYIMGLKQGKEETFFRDGTIRSSMCWHGGLRNGDETWYTQGAAGKPSTVKSVKQWRFGAMVESQQ